MAKNTSQPVIQFIVGKDDEELIVLPNDPRFPLTDGEHTELWLNTEIGEHTYCFGGHGIWIFKQISMYRAALHCEHCGTRTIGFPFHRTYSEMRSFFENRRAANWK